MRQLEQSGTGFVSVPEDYLVGRIIARNMVDADTGEIIAKANDELTEALLKKLRGDYAESADGLTAASQVVAINFQTVAAANNYWRK